MTVRAIGLCVVGLLAMCVRPAMAQESPMLDGMPAELFNRMIAVQEALASVSDIEVARGVYKDSTIWPPQYRKLNVCFFGGSEEARRLIAQKAMAWMRSPRLYVPKTSAAVSGLCRPTG